jgi:hypothetical protein
MSLERLKIRNRSIYFAHKSGRSYAEIGRAYGLSGFRVSQIVARHPRDERLMCAFAARRVEDVEAIWKRYPRQAKECFEFFGKAYHDQ